MSFWFCLWIDCVYDLDYEYEARPSPRARLGLSERPQVAYRRLHCARRGLDKTIVSTTAPERAVLSVLSLGVAFTN